MYLKGEGVKKDEKMAVAYLRRASLLDEKEVKEEEEKKKKEKKASKKKDTKKKDEEEDDEDDDDEDEHYDEGEPDSVALFHLAVLTLNGQAGLTADAKEAKRLLQLSAGIAPDTDSSSKSSSSDSHGHGHSHGGHSHSHQHTSHIPNLMSSSTNNQASVSHIPALLVLAVLAEKDNDTTTATKLFKQAKSEAGGELSSSDVSGIEFTDKDLAKVWESSLTKQMPKSDKK
jgi:hypothetical protein